MAFRVEFSKRAARRNGETISPNSVNDTMGVRKAILDEAAARFGFVSPCLNIKRLKVLRTDVQPFTLDEAKLLIETIRKDYRAYLTVRMYTGMRTGDPYPPGSGEDGAGQGRYVRQAVTVCRWRWR